MTKRKLYIQIILPNNRNSTVENQEQKFSCCIRINYIFHIKDIIATGLRFKPVAMFLSYVFKINFIIFFI